MTQPWVTGILAEKGRGSREFPWVTEDGFPWVADNTRTREYEDRIRRIKVLYM